MNVSILMIEPTRDPEGRERRYLNDVAQLQEARVLEVGCGDGRMTWLYGYGAKLIAGVDIDGDELQAALFDVPKDFPAQTIFAKAQSEHLPFGSGSFDAVIFAWSY